MTRINFNVIELLKNTSFNDLDQLFSDMLNEGSNKFIKFYIKLSADLSDDNHQYVYLCSLEDKFVKPIKTCLQGYTLTLYFLYKILFASIRLGHTKIFKLLSENHRIDLSYKNNKAIISASNCGQFEIVQLLLQNPRVDPSDRRNSSIICASANGHIEVVKLLLQDPRVDPSVGDMIERACRCGYIEIAMCLLQDSRVNPSVQNNHIFKSAIVNGYIEIVKLLLQDPRVNPSDEDNCAIILASQICDGIEIFRLIIQDPRVDPSADNNISTFLTYKYNCADALELLLQDPRVASTVDIDYLITDQNPEPYFYADKYESVRDALCHTFNDDIYEMFFISFEANKVVNQFLFKRYLRSKVDEKTSVYIYNYFKEDISELLYSKDERDKIFENHYKRYEKKIITIQRWYSEIYYRPDNLGARLAKLRFEGSLNMKV